MLPLLRRLSRSRCRHTCVYHLVFSHHRNSEARQVLTLHIEIKTASTLV